MYDSLMSRIMKVDTYNLASWIVTSWQFLEVMENKVRRKRASWPSNIMKPSGLVKVRNKSEHRPRKREKTTTMWRRVWIMVLLHFRVGPRLDEIVKQVLWEIEGLQRRLLSQVKWTTWIGRRWTDQGLSPPRASSHMVG